jgi:hypothetical protein
MFKEKNIIFHPRFESVSPKCTDHHNKTKLLEICVNGNKDEVPIRKKMAAIATKKTFDFPQTDRVAR